MTCTVRVRLERIAIGYVTRTAFFLRASSTCSLLCEAIDIRRQTDSDKVKSQPIYLSECCVTARIVRKCSITNMQYTYIPFLTYYQSFLAACVHETGYTLYEAAFNRQFQHKVPNSSLLNLVILLAIYTHQHAAC